MSENPLEDLLEKGGNELDVNTILNKLLTNDDIALKTELHNPLAIAQLKTLADYLESIKLKKCAATINNFITAYCEFMVSYKRQGRLEIAKAVSRLLNEQVEADRAAQGKLP